MSTDSGEKRIGVIRLLLIGLWLAIVVAVPALGVWAASSLAAYRNGPVQLVCAAGLLLFPVLPLLWEARAARRRSRRHAAASGSAAGAARSSQTLTFGDRLVLRTLALNLVFLAGVLALFPAFTFAALATRGDWFLDGRSGPRVDEARLHLFRLASRLEGLYARVRRNRFEGSLDPSARRLPEARPVPPPVAPVPIERTVEAGSGAAIPGAPSAGWGVAGGEAAGRSLPWPLPATLHPVVAGLSPADETTLQAVARTIGAAERDPWQRVKALHDWVADRIAYDVDGYRAAVCPPQDAETVFRTRKAVCAGYANLLAAMGNAIGEEIRVVPGDARQQSSDLTGSGHAWSAARVSGRWVLIDTTWDAGTVGEGGFTKRYDTRYLFVPPAVIGVTHFPEDEAWQLREPPFSRGEFFRQPVLGARFFAEGLVLVSPDRSQVTVEKDVTMTLGNPRGRSLLAHVELADGGTPMDCRVAAGPESRVHCVLPGRGRYRLKLFSAERRDATHDFVGEIEVNATGG